jgi:rod shape-determining protein MreD
MAASANASHVARHGPNPWVVSLVVVFVAALVQATLVSRVRFLGACPNLPLVMVVSWALLRGVLPALPIAFVLGLFFDLLAGLPLGASSLGLMATTLLAGLGTRRVFSTNILWPALLVAIATPIYAFFVLAALQFAGTSVDWVEIALQVTAPELVLNVLLTLLVYPAMRWFMGILYG